MNDRKADVAFVRTERKPRKRRAGGWHSNGGAARFMPARYSHNTSGVQVMAKRQTGGPVRRAAPFGLVPRRGV